MVARVRRAGLILGIATLAGALVTPRIARADEASPPPFQLSPAAAVAAWAAVQLVPSPMVVTGSSGVGFGMRWQLTPLSISWGVAARPVRPFVVDPIARHSGSIEIFASPEWACCAPAGGTAWIGRAGARMYFPIADHGEALSWSLGGSYYRASEGGGGSLEAGIYFLFGVFGFTVTVSPDLAQRQIMNAFSIRYF